MRKLLLLLAVVGMTVACQKEDIPNSEGVEVTPSAWVSASDNTKIQPSTSKAPSCGKQILDFVNFTPDVFDTELERQSYFFADYHSDRLCSDEYRVFSSALRVGENGGYEQRISFYDTKLFNVHGRSTKPILTFRVDENLQIKQNDFSIHTSLAYLIQPFLYHFEQGDITGNIFQNESFIAAIGILEEYAARGVTVSNSKNVNYRTVQFPEGTTNVGVGLRTHGDFYWYGNFDGSLDTILNEQAIDWIEFRYWINGEDTTERFYL